MPIHAPHPVRIIGRDCIDALNLTMTEAEPHPQVKKSALPAICAHRAPITAYMAARSEQALGSTAAHWLRMQSAHDLAQARMNTRDINRIERAV